MRRSVILRVLTLALAFVHTFPARKHLLAFAASASWSEGLKGFGAAFAIALYLLPTDLQRRGLAFLWRERRVLLRAAGIALAAVHLVPAIDHVPAFFAAPSWADAWRGFGSSIAVAWFLVPLPLQARLLSFLGRVARLPPPHPVTVTAVPNAVREP
jgi:hypothetical protein